MKFSRTKRECVWVYKCSNSTELPAGIHSRKQGENRDKTVPLCVPTSIPTETSETTEPPPKKLSRLLRTVDSDRPPDAGLLHPNRP